MKPILIPIAFIVILLINVGAAKNYRGLSEISQVQDTVAADREKHLVSLRELIKGKGRKAADSVFKNIQMFKGVPAGRLLAIMDIGYSQSLGVSCGHCHNTKKWESDEKPQKQIARDMSAMSAKTNQLIKEIKGLRSENPIVNCTTCHRGSIKPALDLN